MTEQNNISFFQKVASGDSQGLSVYMMGIGGIGMSALARYFLSRGLGISGYDKTRTALTIQLEEEGMKIHYEENADLVDRNCSLVIYTPAIPKGHKEWDVIKQLNVPLMKRSEVLGQITRSSFNVCVAGTHGKTTTSTMVAHILRDSNWGCNAFLGGISGNYGVNFWSHPNNVCVVEADEYDRSFLQLSPNMAIITAMDPDHLDIYGDEASFCQAFKDFANKVKPGGKLFLKYGLDLKQDKIQIDAMTYSLQDENADIHAKNIEVRDGSYVFDIDYCGELIHGVVLSMGGTHNIENVLAAFSVAKEMGVDTEKIKKALANFKGVHRRFEYVLKNENHVLIDDYAHHPGELDVLIDSVKMLYPNRKNLLIFQPHLYTRTRDFAEGFAHSLSKADQTWLLPIYPARELPMEGVSSEMIAGKMKHRDVKCFSKQEMLEEVVKIEKGTVIVMAGAGDIDILVEQVIKKIS